MAGLTDILRKVQKPGRYIGEETNAVRKTAAAGRISVLLAYPDLYEVGMSYLGLKVLYHLLNDRDDVVCERAFAPWIDMEEELRKNNIELFSLESKRPVRGFDIVGFSLSYELTYTNVLNMLHLAGIPVAAKDRGKDDPFVIAGGACCSNPEPMSGYIDIFFLGDAEETLPEFIEAFKRLRSTKLTRSEKLVKLSGCRGVYVPALYKPLYEDSRFAGLETACEKAPLRVDKNVVADLDKAFYPVKQLVPLIKIVHDRISMEIMRGCPNTCRFCQASRVNRPVRIRTPDKLRRLCVDTYRGTGYSQISLLSLSSVNYPYLNELVDGINSDFEAKGVSISIPSLRVDEAFYDLPEIISAVKKAGLTFAPETAGAENQKSIGKLVDYEVLCRSARLAYTHGWNRLKLYFMVGFPVKDEEKEVRDIISWAEGLSELKRGRGSGAAEIRLSVNPFIPKPHTPFQWMGMRPERSLVRARDFLVRHSSRKIKVDFHDVNKSCLEGCLSRGDRRMGDVILSAWKNGARLDSWIECFDFSIWKDAFAENGMDIFSEASKSFPMDAALPWAHIGAGPEETYLRSEFIESGFSRDNIP